MLQSVERCVEGAVTVLGEGSLKALCGSQMSHVRGRSVGDRCLKGDWFGKWHTMKFHLNQMDNKVL